MSLRGAQVEISNFNFFVVYNLFSSSKRFFVKLTEIEFIKSEETEIKLLQTETSLVKYIIGIDNTETNEELYWISPLT